MREARDILTRTNEDSSVHAYYGRDKQENPQEFIAPLSKELKYTEEEIELLEDGIKRIPISEVNFLLS